jgi:glycosyltransferase involved in cell wall biosynthesis
MISFVVPAHNEQAHLPRTLQAIHDAACVVRRPYEVIVVDDASTDATAEIARRNGARVVGVNHRQIAATRNSGARAACGEQIFFVDADTTVNARAVTAAVRAMDKGAAGGGAPTWLGRDEVVPLYIRLIVFLGVVGAKLLGFTGGAFMFCTGEAFRATGGFNERLYWSEEGGFELALKREGRFVVLWQYVLTSGRRFRTNSGLQILTLVARAAFSPRKMMTQRSSVEKVWYDSNRANDDKMPGSPATRISNGIALLVILVVFSGPLWSFVPWSLTPLGTPLGDVRLVIGVFLCHLGLVFWPVALILFINLLRQKRWTGLVQSVALVAFFSWHAWDATEGVIWFWPWVYHGIGTFLRG